MTHVPFCLSVRRGFSEHIKVVQTKALCPRKWWWLTAYDQPFITISTYGHWQCHHLHNGTKSTVHKAASVWYKLPHNIANIIKQHISAIFGRLLHSLQCFNTVTWAAGRASGLYKTEWWGAGIFICLKRIADLQMAQLMPLPLTVSCFSKMVPAHPGSPENGPWSRCVYVSATGLFLKCFSEFPVFRHATTHLTLFDADALLS